MNRWAALSVVSSFPGNLLVSELYDHDSTFAGALNDLFPGTFEYPDYAHRKISEVVEIAAIARAHQAAEEALVLASELESRIRAELKEDLHDVSQMPSAVRMAYREMGVDPREDAEKSALQGIEARSMAYAGAEATAKASKIEGSPDLNTRLRVMRNMTVTVLSPEVSRMWAELDIRDFLKIQMSPHRKEDAGLLLATNMAANAEYKTALIEKNPVIAAMATALDAENERRIAEKEERKAADFAGFIRWNDFAVGDTVLWGHPDEDHPAHEVEEWQVLELHKDTGMAVLSYDPGNEPPYLEDAKICDIQPKFIITKNDKSGMVGLSRHGESRIVEFGGIPAIQAFGEETPEVPVYVINELLAREGGYTRIKVSGETDVLVMHPDENRIVVRNNVQEAWAAAAASAVRHSELSDLRMRCEMLVGVGNQVTMENPWGGDGEWAGPVVLVSDLYLVQSLGENRFVVHEKTKFCLKEPLIGLVEIGTFMEVKQQRGQVVDLKTRKPAAVEPEFEEAECVPACRP